MALKDLSPADAQRLSALLDEALELDDTARSAWLAALPGREPLLAPLAGELLAALADDPGRVETDALLARRVARASQASPGLEGRRFGPYRVLRLLGHGGMGSVWLAERSDGLFERQVALKLVHASLFGGALAERFARERSILATLDHPHIARLLDAGVSDEGQPYLAIELVDGMPLTAYCDAKHLSVRPRVELFLQVLSAVQHAHQNLVVHRDIKPSNILVTGDGQVRLLDFGIAKLMTEGQAAETELTQLGGRALTPDYASPEQIGGQAVGTASDVYSLGVVLCELLAGERPYRLRRHARGGVEAAALDAEAPLASSLVGDPDRAAARGTNAPALVRALKGDLDTIVAKAIRKSPAERYPTAQALADDLRRHLLGEPVLARPAGRLYRFGRFVRRHKLAIATSTAIACVLVGATLVSWRQAQVARLESKRANATQEFVLDLFRANTRKQEDPVKARQTTALELLDVGTRRIDDALKDAPEAQQEMLNTMAWLYYELGMSDRSAELRLKRVAVLKRIHGGSDVRVADALRLAAIDLADTDRRGETPAILAEASAILDAAGDHSSQVRGDVLIEQARYEKYRSVTKSIAYAQQAIAIFRRLGLTGREVEARRFVGKALVFQGRLDEARTWQRETLAEAQRIGERESEYIAMWVELAESQHALAEIDDAEANFRAAVDATFRVDGEFHAETVRARLRLGSFLHKTARTQAGRELLEELVRMVDDERHRELRPLRPDVYGVYGWTVLADGRPADAGPYLAVDLEDLRRNYAGSDALASHLVPEGERLTALGRLDEAGTVLEEALKTHREAAGAAADRSSEARYRLAQARLAVAMADPARATARLAEIAAPTFAARQGLRADETEVRLLRAEAYRAQGKLAESLAEATQALEHVRQSPVRRYFQRLEADALEHVGFAQRLSKQFPEACRNLDAALALRTGLERPDSIWLARNEVEAADCHADNGDTARAQALFEHARGIYQTHAELGEHLRQPLRALQARLAGRDLPRHAATRSAGS